jgi:hypothetical protein
MVELKIHLDEWIVATLSARARRRSVSLEQELRATLLADCDARRAAFARRAARLRALSPPPDDPALDSARIIRGERNRSG